MTVDNRGTSNTNDRGSAEARRQRKKWLFKTWAADVDVVTSSEWIQLYDTIVQEAATEVSWRDDGYGNVLVPPGLGRPAVRCFRCGRLCDWESVEIDRIKPGCEGGRYTRNNIRPACESCNKSLAGEYVRRRNAKRQARNQRRRDLRRKCGACGAVPATGNACESKLIDGKWVTTYYCHPDEGYSCYSGDIA